MVDRVRAGEVRVDFTGRATEFQAAARRASSALRRQQRQLTFYQRVARQANVQNRALGAGFAALGAIVSVQAVRGLARVSDQSRQLTGRLGLVTESSEELAQVWSDLSSVANETSASYESTVGVYVRLSQALGESGATAGELTGVVRTLNQAVALSGVSSEAARAALTQLGQGFAAGALRGEELNSVLEQTPAVAQAIASGLGVAVGALRGLAAEGALTAEEVFGALQNVASETETAYLSLPRTIGRAIQELNNQVFDIFRSTDETSRSTERVIDAIDTFGRVLRENEDQIVGGFTLIAQAAALIASQLQNLLIVLGLFVGGRVLGGVVSSFASGAVSVGFFGRALVSLRGTAAAASESNVTLSSALRRVGSEAVASGNATENSQRALQGAFAQTRAAQGAFAASLGGLITVLGTVGRSLGAVGLVLGGLYLGFALLRRNTQDAIPSIRAFESTTNRTTEALREQRQAIRDLTPVYGRFAQEANAFRDSQEAIRTALIERDELRFLQGDSARATSAAQQNVADRIADSARTAFLEFDRLITIQREAAEVESQALRNRQALSQFDETDPNRAILASRQRDEAAITAIIRQQERIALTGDAEQRANALELLATIMDQRDVWQEISDIRAETAAQDQLQRNEAIRAAGATSADRLIGGIQNDVSAAARANNRASQLSGFDQNNPARAALEAELLVLDRLQARYDELNLIILTGSAEQAIAAQAELDRLMMQTAAVEGLARARGTEAGAAQAAANQTRELAAEQQRAAALSMELARSFESAAESIIFDSGGAREAVVALAEEILRAIVRALIIRPLIAGLTGGLGLPGFQQGGFTSGGPAVVGENGPELVDFNRPARIYSNRDSRELFGNAGGGGGGFVQNLSFNVAEGASRAEVEQAILVASPQIRDATIAAMTRGLSRPSRTRTIVSGR